LYINIYTIKIECKFYNFISPPKGSIGYPTTQQRRANDKFSRQFDWLIGNPTVETVRLKDGISIDDIESTLHNG